MAKKLDNFFIGKSWEMGTDLSFEVLLEKKEERLAKV